MDLCVKFDYQWIKGQLKFQRAPDWENPWFQSIDMNNIPHSNWINRGYYILILSYINPLITVW